MLNPITFLSGVALGYWLCSFSSRGKNADPSQRHGEDTKRDEKPSTPPYYADQTFSQSSCGVQNPIIPPEITSSDFDQDLTGSENTPALNEVEEKSDDGGGDNDEHESCSDAFRENGDEEQSLKSEADKFKQNEELEQSDLALNLELPPHLDNDDVTDEGVESNCCKENKAVSSFLDSLSRFVDSLDSLDNDIAEYLKNELVTIITDFSEKRFSRSQSEKGAEDEDNEIWLEMVKRIGSFLEELDSLLLKGDSEVTVIREALDYIGISIISNGAEVIDVDTGFDSLRHRNVESDFIPTGTEISETVSPGFIANGKVVKRALVRVNHRQEASNE